MCLNITVMKMLIYFPLLGYAPLTDMIIFINTFGESSQRFCDLSVKHTVQEMSVYWKHIICTIIVSFRRRKNIKRGFCHFALATNEEIICIFLSLCKMSGLKFSTWLPLPFATDTYNVAFQRCSESLKSFKNTITHKGKPSFQSFSG